MDVTSLPYRPCVGIMLINQDNKVFVGQRLDQIAEAWQMPQGGIDEGEAPEVAAFRELGEEVGTNKAEIIAQSADWLTYDLPPDLVGRMWKGRYRGQKQKWFAMRFLGQDSDIDITTHEPEFMAWRWIEPRLLPEVIVPFKRELYTRIVAEFDHLFPR